ncbi:MAG: autotransporter-associated beta strand repeat-containing protein [Planctomycetia bacterium]|nr:autotransporter-associated beta strand repeat-containing protein [Planctomycetia bacterium]
MKKTSVLTLAMLLLLAAVGSAQTNPNVFDISVDTSKTFAELDRTSTDYVLTKTGTGTLTMTDSLGDFKVGGSSSGASIAIWIQSGPAYFNLRNSSTNRNAITIGSETTTATLTTVGKALGEHYGSVTIYNGSELKFTSNDTSIASNTTLTFVGGGTISGSEFNYRDRSTTSSATPSVIAVTGANANALISANMRLIEGPQAYEINVVDSTGTLTISSSIYDYGGDYKNKGFIKTGAGTLVLSNHNTFAAKLGGGLDVQAGVVKLEQGEGTSAGSRVGTNTLSIASGAEVIAYADYMLGSGDDAVIPNVVVAGTLTTYGTTAMKTLTLNGGTVRPTATTDTLLFQERTNGVDQKISSTGTSTITTSLVLDAATEFAVTSGTLSVGAVSGTGLLTKTGAGKLTFTTPLIKTFTGKYNVQEGTLTLASPPEGIRDTKSPIDYIIGSVSTQATLEMNFKSLADHQGAITIYDGSTLITASDATVCDSNTLTFVGGGEVTAKSGGYYLFRNRLGGKSTNIVVTGTNAQAEMNLNAIWFVENSGNGVIFDIDDTNTLTLSGCMFNHSAGGGKGFTKTGAGTLVLSVLRQDYSIATGTSLSQFFGAIAISEGALQLGSDNGVSTNVTDLSLAAGTQFDLAGFDQTLAKISGTGSVTNSGAEASTLTLGYQKNYYTHDGSSTDPVYTSSTFAGTASGNVNLVIDANTETVTLSGANTYTGDTTVASGTLKLGADNAISSDSGVVQTRGTATIDLAGYDQTLGASEVSGNFINSVSATPTTLTLTPNSGTLSMEETYVGEGISVVSNGMFQPKDVEIAQGLTVNGTLVFDLDALRDGTALTLGDLNFGTDAAVSVLFDLDAIMSYERTSLVDVTNDANVDEVYRALLPLIEASQAGYYFNLDVTGGVLTLNLDHAAVPEPASWALLLLGLGLLFRRRGRRE